MQNEEHAPFLHRIHEEICRQCIEASPDQICHWIDRGNASEFSDRFWTLDPIDGTKGFLRGGQYAVCLALIVDGDVKLGVIGCPNLPVDNSEPLSTNIGSQQSDEEGPRFFSTWLVSSMRKHSELVLTFNPVVSMALLVRASLIAESFSHSRTLCRSSNGFSSSQMR